ncbi:hypothetical protein A5320_18165 [Rheinheimera sp. SA_1]|uniref:non-ribosomal peptide synthetase n=1 Tax=Rheinheimera sp. SA_1 TaxID=1827365 RepID=UPI0007FDCF81|nr:non-ribosomal peptide synthetase [Rheinheimera sp. SA_1]OBP13475.1 hypothetical protein A5320_18165 [Rheinheimera sp. SA_1]
MIRELLKRLTESGVYLYLEGDELKFKAKTGGFTEALKAEVKANRPAIIEYLCSIQQTQRNSTAALPPIEAAAATSSAPLSFAQHRIWFAEQLGAGKGQYNTQGMLPIAGVLQRPELERALATIVERHQVLRSCYHQMDGEPYQQVLHDYQLPLCYLDLKMLDGVAQQQAVTDYRAAQLQLPFDLSVDLMLRVGLLSLSEQRHLMVFTLHHIASDAWSIALFSREFSDLYQAYLQAAPNPLRPLMLQYTDYACWQRHWFAGAAMTAQLDYWKNQLAGIPFKHALPLDQPRSPTYQPVVGRMFHLLLDKATTAQLRMICERHDVTLFMLLHSAFALLLSRYSNERDIVMATLLAGRNQSALEPLIGFFVNTLVLRSDVVLELSFAELLQRNKQMILAAYQHQHLPFEMLVDTLQPSRDPNVNPLAQILFVLQNTEQKSTELLRSVATEGLSRTLLPTVENAAVKFDLELLATEVGDRLLLGWGFNQQLFAEDSIQRMASNFNHLLDSLCSFSQTGQLPQLAELSACCLVEQQLLLGPFRGNPAPLAAAELLQMFEQQARHNPDAKALVHGKQSLSYRELNDQVNQLAAFLTELGLRPGDNIAVCFEHGINLAWAILAVAKMGGCYLPLDPGYPERRLDYMLKDSACKLLLSDGYLLEGLAGLSWCRSLSLDSTRLRYQLAGYDSRNHRPAISADYPLYIIYTSGSTGTPKATVISRHNVLRLVCNDFMSFSGNRTLCAASPAFDAFTYEFWTTLCHGGCCVMFDLKQAGIAGLAAVLAEQQITAAWLTSAFFNQVVNEDVQKLAPLKWLLVGGEALSPEHVTKALRSLPDTQLVNGYGPTESTTFATSHQLKPTASYAAGSIPIGRPLAYTEVLIFDYAGQLAPLGAIGELYLGGQGLAHCYANQPGQTAAQFVPHPFAGKPGQRLYRTGDLARFLPDGTLLFVGRADHQLKLRGYRIELSEIEQALLRLDNVRAAAVVARDDLMAQTCLVAYLVTATAAEVGDEQAQAAAEALLKTRYLAALGQLLPAYLIPNVIVFVAQLPLTQNGKVNKQALPCPVAADLQLQSYMAPSTSMEQIVCTLFQSVLNLEQVGVHDDFFVLGGHSLLATRVISQLRQQLALEVPLRQLFEHSVAQAFAARLEVLAANAGSLKLPTMTACSEAGKSHPLSFAQQRLWFVDQLGHGSAQYNMPGTLRLTGDFNAPAFTQAVDSVLQRHHILRTVYGQQDGQAFQQVLTDYNLPLQLIDLTDAVPAVAQTQIQQHYAAEMAEAFDLSADLMLRLRVLLLPDARQLVIFCMHHIASDGWSVELFKKELKSYYHALSAGMPVSPPPLAVQYADYAYWQQRPEIIGWLAQQLDYWRRQLEGLPQLHSLPTDRPRPAQQTFQGHFFQQPLSKELTARIRTFCRQQDVTLFMLLQTAFAVLLARYSNEQDIVIGSAIAGRTEAQTEELIGLFLNILVLRTDLSGNPTVVTLLKRNKEMILQAYEHQHLPFERLVEHLAAERSLSHNAVVQILFGVQNNSRAEQVELSDDIADLLMTDQGFVVMPMMTRHDLKLDATEVGDRLSLSWLYNTALFDDATLFALADCYVALLQNMMAYPDCSIDMLDVLPADCREQVLRQWNCFESAYPVDQCMHQLFEHQLVQHAAAPALIFEHIMLNYQELNQAANQLAHYLRKQGVGPEKLVAVYLQRSVQQVVTLLAILKAGGAYVPLDVGSPPQRIDYMLRDCGAQWIVTDLQHALQLPERSAALLCLDAADTRLALDQSPLDNPYSGVCAGNLAYVIYTSGSTGNPKGVQVQHDQLCDFLHHAVAEFLPEHIQGAVVSSTMVFDATVGSLWVPLVAGRFAELLPEGAAALDRLGDCLLDDETAYLFKLTPSHLEAVQAKGFVPPSPRACHLLVVAGEPLPPATLQIWAEHILPAADFVNEYGPTETTVGATIFPIARAKQPWLLANIPIGKALGVTELYVLNADMVPQGPGALGELYIGGAGVARGYLNNAAMTAGKFVPNPFAREAGARLYRSGDIVRMLPDGELQFIGRGDHQVKIRGYRIELAEVEAKLTELAVISQALVIAKEVAGHQNLVVYLVAERSEADPAEIALLSQQHLMQYLPRYMVPEHYVVLDAMPLNQNGKIDRHALPAPGRPVGAQATYQPPETDIERSLSELFQQLLQVEPVGLDDSFFALGGHSLLATRLISQVRETFAVELPLKSLFEQATVRAVAARVTALIFNKKSVETQQQLAQSTDVEEVILE